MTSQQHMRSPRIMLIHAVREAIDPVHASFARHWPEAERHDLLDTSLSADLAAQGGKLDARMRERFLTLGRYAHTSGPDGRITDAILFTCSAFGPAIEAVQGDLPIPVSKPNEAAFLDAVAAGSRIALVVTFAPSMPPLRVELADVAARQGKSIEVTECVVDGAMAALRAGHGDEHDALVADAARALSNADVIILGQFSTARAAPMVAQASGRPVVTTPDSAVTALRRALSA